MFFFSLSLAARTELQLGLSKRLGQVHDPRLRHVGGPVRRDLVGRAEIERAARGRVDGVVRREVQRAPDIRIGARGQGEQKTNATALDARLAASSASDAVNDGAATAGESDATTSVGTTGVGGAAGAAAGTTKAAMAARTSGVAGASSGLIGAGTKA